jgi:hypothetical protein
MNDPRSVPTLDVLAAEPARVAELDIDGAEVLLTRRITAQKAVLIRRLTLPLHGHEVRRESDAHQHDAGQIADLLGVMKDSVYNLIRWSICIDQGRITDVLKEAA